MRGALTIVNSTISGNTASSHHAVGVGGGIENLKAGKLTVINSTISENAARGTGTDNSNYARGGGIDNNGKLTVINSTISENTTSSSGTNFGGGIFFLGPKNSSANIYFSTIYRNTSNVGGGISIDPTQGGQVTIGDSIVATNSAQDSPDIAGVLVSDGYNLVTNGTGANGLNSTDRLVAPADLKIDSALHNNGGPTQTLKLLPGSPALDAIPGNRCSIAITDVSGHTEKIATDQLDHPRLHRAKNACDIGAT